MNELSIFMLAFNRFRLTSLIFLFFHMFLFQAKDEKLFQKKTLKHLPKILESRNQNTYIVNLITIAIMNIPQLPDRTGRS